MFPFFRFLTCFLLAILFGLTVVGCSKQTPQEQPKSVTSPEKSPKLSAEDTALAKKQGTCPVSGDVLGAMGTPYKVTIQGKTVFLCCSGCEEELRKNPEKYLAKLNTSEEHSTQPK